MNITIIAYRENGDDYCMGSIMARTDSSFEINYVQGEDTDTIIVEMANIIKHHFFEEEVYAGDNEFNDYEITILVDGMEISKYSPYQSLISKAMSSAQSQADAMFIKYKNGIIRAERAETEKAEEVALAKRKADFEKLQQEFGNE